MSCLCEACLSPEEKRKAMEGWPDDAKETMTKVAKIIADAVNSAPCPTCAAFRAKLDREKLAKVFHDAYERLAPVYQYATRPESALPWDDVKPNLRELMMATCDAIIAYLKEG